MAAKPSSRLCYVCGRTFPDLAARLAHLAADHPGYRIAWKGRDPLVVDPEGGERLVTKAEAARMRRAGKATATPKPPTVRTRKAARTIESLAPAATIPDDDAPAPDDGPMTPAGRRPFVSQPTVRITPEYRRENMRDTVAEAFTLDMLATILRDLSIVVSEADGAGEEGHLSKIQAVQLANLLYDVTVDVIVSRFAGNVGRFKMALAAVLILASKGRIHARAIGAKMTRARAERDATRQVAEAIARTEQPYAIPTDPRLDDLTDPIAILAARQREHPPGSGTDA